MAPRVKSIARWLRGPLLNPDVAIAHEFRPPPFGGSNQFLIALRDELRRRGLRVEPNAIGPHTRACVLNAFAFDAARIRKMRYERCRIVHCVAVQGVVERGRRDGSE